MNPEHGNPGIPTHRPSRRAPVLEGAGVGRDARECIDAGKVGSEVEPRLPVELANGTGLVLVRILEERGVVDAGGPGELRRLEPAGPLEHEARDPSNVFDEPVHRSIHAEL